MAFRPAGSYFGYASVLPALRSSCSRILSTRSRVEDDGRSFRLLQRDSWHRQPTPTEARLFLRHRRQTACAGILPGCYQQVGGVVHDETGGVRVLRAIGAGNLNPFSPWNRLFGCPMLIGYAPNGLLSLGTLGMQDRKNPRCVGIGLPDITPSSTQHSGRHHVLILHPKERLMSGKIEGRLGQLRRSKHSCRPVTGLDALDRPLGNLAPTVGQQTRIASDEAVVQFGHRLIVGRHPVQADDSRRRLGPLPRLITSGND